MARLLLRANDQRDIWRSIAARMNRANRGCGRLGRDLNSGWNWQPTKYGCCGSSNISTSRPSGDTPDSRSEEHTSELQSRFDLVCRLLLEKKKKFKVLICNVTRVCSDLYI